MPRLLAPSISSTSTSSPVDTLRQTSHSLHGVGVGPFTQLSAFAKIRAADVFPTPRGTREQIGVTNPVARDRLLAAPAPHAAARPVRQTSAADTGEQ